MKRFLQRDFRDTHPNMGKALLFGLLAFVVAVAITGQLSKAKAQDIKPSIYIGAHAGAALANTSVDIPPGNIVDGLGAESKTPVFGAHAGVDFNMPGSAVFFGPRATYTVQDVEFSAIGGNLSASMKNSWSIGARAGVQLGGAKPYILAAYRQTDLEWTNFGTGLPSKLKGYDLGAGLSYAIDKNLDLGVEGIWTKYDSQDLCGGCGLTMQTDQLSVVAFLNFKIGGPEEVAAKPAAKAKKIAP